MDEFYFGVDFSCMFFTKVNECCRNLINTFFQAKELAIAATTNIPKNDRHFIKLHLIWLVFKMIFDKSFKIKICIRFFIVSGSLELIGLS